MCKINSKMFYFSFFLSGRVEVNDLTQAAKKHGGATYNAETKEMYSNVAGNEFIELKKERELNTLSIFIPDTVDVNQHASKEHVKKVVSTVFQRIMKKYGDIPTVEHGLGSWYSNELHQVIFDNLIITSVHIEDVTESDVKFFISLAKYIKKEMRQEAVSININDALALV